MRSPARYLRLALCLGCAIGLAPLWPAEGGGALAQEGAKPAASKPVDKEPGDKEPATKWRPLFDGKTLENWKPTNFGGEGEVTVKDGELHIASGAPISGITWSGKELPKTNYEISLEAQRVDGGDFFCGLTFPVKKEYCSFIVGGWGGGVVGISSVDGQDASENQTTTYQSFDSKKWYKVRVRVTDDHLSAWIDDKQVVDQELEGHKLSTRIEVDLSKPLGVSCYATSSALRDFKIRELSKEEAAPKKAEK